MNQKSLRWVEVIQFNIFFEIKSWVIEQWVLHSITEEKRTQMIHENVKKWEALLIRLKEKKLLKSHIKD